MCSGVLFSSLCNNPKRWSLPKVKISKVDLAWIAGFFDGEGNIGINRRFRGGVHYVLRVGIYQAHIEVLEFIQSVFGGTIGKRTGNGANKLPGYHLRLHARFALRFLESVCPFLRTTKKEQAEIAIEFQKGKTFSHKHKIKTGKRGNASLTPERISYEEECKIKISFLCGNQARHHHKI